MLNMFCVTMAFTKRQVNPKMMALLFWLLAIGSYWWYTHTQNLGPMDTLKLLTELLTARPLGPLLFVMLFALQPLIFFPSIVMGIMAGCLYGAVEGVIYAVVGANCAASVTYTVGYFFGQGWLTDPNAENPLQKYVDSLRNNTFEAILTMDLLFMPFDLINYTAGFLQVRWRAFALATALGALPGTVTVVLFGASLEGDMLAGQWPEFDYRTLAISLAILVTSLILSRYLRWRRQS